jgi:hypothetical protein
MAYPVNTTPWPTGSSNPNPAYSGTFIPEIWSGKLLEKFYDATVLAAIANTDYEGEISNKGDKVNIRTQPAITIRAYEANQALVVDRPAAPIVTLIIDQGRYFNLILDDVMRIQADIDLMNVWSSNATEQMKVDIDSWVLSHIAADIAAANAGATAGRISANLNLGTAVAPLVLANNPTTGQTDPVEAILRLGQVLDEQNVPESGRWLIVPAWMSRLIKNSILRDAALTGDGMTPLRNGRLGMIDRFTLFGSNLLPIAGGNNTLMAGHSMGLTFAAQFTKMETLRSEFTFGTLMRGLQVFGHKVTMPICLAAMVAKSA